MVYQLPAQTYFYQQDIIGGDYSKHNKDLPAYQPV
jgi:hypothetical protein